jgi:hypothetical protein
MTTKEIIERFSKNEAKECVPSTDVLSELMRRTELKYIVDEDGMSYICMASILDLAKSELPEETVKMMLEEGWTVSKDRKFLQIFS